MVKEGRARVNRQPLLPNFSNKSFQKGGSYTWRMSTVRFTDGEWAAIQRLVPPAAKTGRPRTADRKTLEGILYVLRSGCRWQDVPRRDGAPTTVLKPPPGDVLPLGMVSHTDR